MSIQAVAWVLENSEATLGARCVLIAVANHADENGENAWAAVKTYGHEAKMSERGARDALRRLEADDEIEIYGTSHAGTHLIRIPGMKRSIEREEEAAPPRKIEAGGAEDRDTEGGKPASAEPSKATVEDEPKDLLTRPVAERLCVLMGDLTSRRTGNEVYRRRSKTEGWVVPMERLLRIDGRSEEMVEKALRWIDRHDFWNSNVLSPAKLREKFDTLLLQARNSNGGSGASGGAGTIRRDDTDYDNAIERTGDHSGGG